MRSRDLPALIIRNLQTPSTWWEMGIFGSTLALGRLLLGLHSAPHGLAADLLMPYLIALGLATLSPLPWLWTGNDRPRASAPRGILQAIPWNILWLLVLSNLLNHLLPAGRPSRLPPQMLFGSPLGLRIELGFLVFNGPICLFLGWFQAERTCNRAREQETRLLMDQARAQALQAQLNPHTLFNVLGGILELVHEDPDATEEGLIDMVELYRALSAHGAALKTPLAREREIVERYLHLEAIRLEERLEVEWLWPPWADAQELPPLLLLPLVENAVKHGISAAPEGGHLSIEVQRTSGSLSLQVTNSGQPLVPGAPEGTGLGNLRRRLELMHGSCPPRLTLTQVGDEVVARLTLAWRWTP
nr:histidine kinase [uncultured Holophaga sp.]